MRSKLSGILGKGNKLEIRERRLLVNKTNHCEQFEEKGLFLPEVERKVKWYRSKRH